MSALAPTLQAFFTERLVRQRQASPHTIAAYRDTLRLLLAFASDQTANASLTLDLSDLDAPLIGAFLDHLEHEPRQQRRGPATPGWPRSTRCFASPRCATPSTPPTSNASWPSHPNASTGR